ncbi:MAG: hypothetical protein MUF66_08375 [Gammaproteobacteria bacterium]|nr:hypothetical protein [Gammaproteobacteria bacterium]
MVGVRQASIAHHQADQVHAEKAAAPELVDEREGGDPAGREQQTVEAPGQPHPGHQRGKHPAEDHPAGSANPELPEQQ